MKLFMISQNVNNDYDTYDSAVVIADSADTAQRMHPHYVETAGVVPDGHDEWAYAEWARPEFVSVEYLGETAATMPRIICTSYNAG
jgi:hypothetical protein